MRRTTRRSAVTVAVAGVAMAAAAVSAPVSAWAAAPGPVIRLLPAQNSITVPQYGPMTFLDPGIWVATSGSALEFDVQRASYSQPAILTQIIHLPGARPKPGGCPARCLTGGRDYATSSG